MILSLKDPTFRKRGILVVEGLVETEDWRLTIVEGALPPSDGSCSSNRILKNQLTPLLCAETYLRWTQDIIFNGRTFGDNVVTG